MTKKTCQFCNQIFWTHTYRKESAHFCSQKCYNKHRFEKAYPVRTCPLCKKKFTINRKTRFNKYCSQKCANLAQRKHPRQDKNCLYCRKKFKYSYRNPQKTFCSIDCQVKSRAYKVKVNEKFFEKINSEGQAYLLGLIFSDGSISNNRINFSSADKELLIMFANLIELEMPIRKYKNSYSLTITNAVLSKSLLRLGVLQRKSWKEYGLPPIPQNLMWHFLRGFFDGDGSFYIDKRIKYNYLCASITCGSYNFLNEIKFWLNQNNIKTQALRLDKKLNNKGIRQLRITAKQDIKRFAETIYKNSNYFLIRKNNIVKTFYGRRQF